MKQHSQPPPPRFAATVVAVTDAIHNDPPIIMTPIHPVETKKTDHYDTGTDTNMMNGKRYLYLPNINE